VQLLLYPVFYNGTRGALAYFLLAVNKQRPETRGVDCESSICAYYISEYLRFVRNTRTLTVITSETYEKVMIGVIVNGCQSVPSKNKQVNNLVLHVTDLRASRSIIRTTKVLIHQRLQIHASLGCLHLINTVN